jgi:diaminopimelate decarboxylase/aspartate kinase
VDQVFYAMKANPHPEILKLFVAEGLGLECVSRGELEHVFIAQPGSQAHLFTPNLHPAANMFALQQVSGSRWTIYNIAGMAELFKGRKSCCAWMQLWPWSSSSCAHGWHAFQVRHSALRLR